MISKTNINLRLIFLLIFLATIANNSFPYTKKYLLQKELEKNSLQKILIKNQKWVPYPNYTDRAGWDNLLGTYKKEYIKKGENALKYNWTVIKATDYLDYERTGSRSLMEKSYEKNNQAIIDLMLAELAEGKGRFIDQLINGIFYSCEMTSWSIAAHQVQQKDKRSLPNKNEPIIELVSSDMGSVFSWIYYFFHDEFNKINPTISKRLREELEERILTPFLKKNFWWMGFNHKQGRIINNWNPWCNFNVLQCFMLLENNSDRLNQAIERSIKSVDEFINYCKTDGACEEGPAYWGHAAGKLYDYLQLLYDVSGGKLSIFSNPMIRNMGEYISRSYVGNDWVVNFADASAKIKLNANLIYRYGAAVKSTEMMAFAHLLSKQINTNKAPEYGRDIFRTLQTLLYKDKFIKDTLSYSTPQNTWYPETEFCFMKNNNGLFFATKGGHNNESHNHNDVSTFSFYINKTPIIIDAGVGTYTRQTFSNERYNIWTMQSQYHNVPQINGFPQKFGNEYKATKVKYNATQQSFSMDIAKAYPKEAGILSWERKFQLTKDKLTIKEKYHIPQPHKKNQLHFLSWGSIDNSKKGIILIDVEDQKAEIHFDKNKLSSSVETINLNDPRLKKVWGDKIYRITLSEKTLHTNAIIEYSIIKKQSSH